MDLQKASLKLFGANFGSAAIQFGGIALFANLLDAKALGVFFLFEALLGMLAIPADLGLRGAVEKRVSEGQLPGTHISSALVLKVLPITIISLGLLVARRPINDYIGSTVTLLLILAILLYELAFLSIFVLKGELRAGETAELKLIRQITWVVVGGLFVLAGYEADGLIYGLLASLAVMAVWGWTKTSVSFGRPSRESARSLFEYGKFNLVSSLGGYFYTWMDVVLIGLFLGQSAVGAYEVAWRVTAIALLFSNAIGTVILPQVSNWDAQGQRSEIEALITKAITPSLVLVIPALVGTVVLAEDILRLVFGPDFVIAAVAMIVLAGEKVIHAVHTVLGKVLKALDRPDLAAKATIVAVLINLVLNVVLIQEFGISGAAVATALSFVVNTIMHGLYVHRFVRIELPYREIGWCWMAAIVMGLVLFAIKSQLAIDSLVRLVPLIGGGVAVYGSVLLLYRPLRERILSVVGQI